MKQCVVGDHELVPGAVFYTVKLFATEKGRGDNLRYYTARVCRGHVLRILESIEAAPERCGECKKEEVFCKCR